MASKRLVFQKKSMKRPESLNALWIWYILNMMIPQETTEKKISSSKTPFTTGPVPVKTVQSPRLHTS